MTRQERFEEIIYSMNPQEAKAELLLEGYTEDEIPQRIFKAAVKTGDKALIKEIARQNLRSTLAALRG